MDYRFVGEKIGVIRSKLTCLHRLVTDIQKAKDDHEYQLKMQEVFRRDSPTADLNNFGVDDSHWSRQVKQECVYPLHVSGPTSQLLACVLNSLRELVACVLGHACEKSFLLSHICPCVSRG